MPDLVRALVYGAVYTGLGLFFLIAGYLILDALTPGRLGSRIAGNNDHPSYGAGIVSAAWMLSQGAVVATAIYHNASSGFGTSLLWTLSFSLMCLFLLAVSFIVLDKVTPGSLGDEVCAPGRPSPLSILAAGNLLAIGMIIFASTT